MKPDKILFAPRIPRIHLKTLSSHSEPRFYRGEESSEVRYRTVSDEAFLRHWILRLAPQDDPKHGELLQEKKKKSDRHDLRDHADRKICFAVK